MVRSETHELPMFYISVQTYRELTCLISTLIKDNINPSGNWPQISRLQAVLVKKIIITMMKVSVNFDSVFEFVLTGHCPS